MGTSSMVGSIGLTLFCNKCVEAFYRFREKGQLLAEDKETVESAAKAFKSLKWLSEPSTERTERVGLFNTNEEVNSLENALRSSESGVDEAALDSLIAEIESILGDVPLEEGKKKAKKLQAFFNTLGNCSFYATREHIRKAGSFAGI
jgi:hypothetical protein